MLASKTKVAVGSVATHSLSTFFEGGSLKSVEQCYVLGAFMGNGKIWKYNDTNGVCWDQKIMDYSWLNELSAVCCQIADKSQLSLAYTNEHFVPAHIHQRKLSNIAMNNWYASSLTLDNQIFSNSLVDYSLKIKHSDDSLNSVVPKDLFRHYLRGLFESNLNDDHSNVIITKSGNITLELYIDENERFLSDIVGNINEVCLERGEGGESYHITDRHIRPFGNYNNQYSIRVNNPGIIRKLLHYLYDEGSLNSVINDKVEFVLKLLDLSINERVLLIEEYNRKRKEFDQNIQEFLSSYFESNHQETHQFGSMDNRWNSELTIIPDPSSFILPS